MKLIQILPILLFVIFTTSCSTTSKSKSSTTKSIDITVDGVFTKAVIADLDIKETKVTGTATGRTDKNESVDYVKKMALTNAVKNAGADVLVEPVFDVEQINSDIKVTVTGFPASYKHFKPLKWEEDATYLKSRLLLTTTEPTESHVSTTNPLIPMPVEQPAAKKKKKVGNILLGVLGTLLLTLGILSATS